MKTECKKCGHKWNYKGKSKYYVTCPSCYNKIMVGRGRLKLLKDEN